MLGIVNQLSAKIFPAILLHLYLSWSCESLLYSISANSAASIMLDTCNEQFHFFLVVTGKLIFKNVFIYELFKSLIVEGISFIFITFTWFERIFRTNCKHDSRDIPFAKSGICSLINTPHPSELFKPEMHLFGLRYFVWDEIWLLSYIFSLKISCPGKRVKTILLSHLSRMVRDSISCAE